MEYLLTALVIAILGNLIYLERTVTRLSERIKSLERKLQIWYDDRRS